MPHGENVNLVLRDHVPMRVLMKDIGEEVAVCFPQTPVPEGAERDRADVDWRCRATSSTASCVSSQRCWTPRTY
jgi:siderophore synthetase component